MGAGGDTVVGKKLQEELKHKDEQVRGMVGVVSWGDRLCVACSLISI